MLVTPCSPQTGGQTGRRAPRENQQETRGREKPFGMEQSGKMREEVAFAVSKI